MARTTLLFPILLLTGCFAGRSTDGEPFDAAIVSAFEPGTTTAKTVVEQLGPPRRVVELDVRSAYLYQFEQSKNAGLVLFVVNFVNSDVRYDRIWLFFDSRDVLTHVGTELHAHRARFAMPWAKIHTVDKDAQADAKWAAQQAEAKAKLEAEMAAKSDSAESESTGSESTGSESAGSTAAGTE